MKKILISIPFLIVLLFVTHFYLISSGKRNINPAFEPYYNSFLKEAEARGYSFVGQINISINFQHPNPIKVQELALQGKSQLGHCRLIIGQDPIINIDPGYWHQSSDVKKEMIIFHELSHCFLLKGHTNTIHNNLHQSLMNPTIFSEVQYLQNREKYLNELFSYKIYHFKDYVDTFFLKDYLKKIF